MPTAAFRSSVPISGHDKPTRLSREQQLGVVHTSAAVQPGPGEYNQGGTSFAGYNSRRSPQFCDSNLDRFGLPVPGVTRSSSGGPNQLTPGPGAYLRDEPRPTAVISGSVFMSGTSRSGPSSSGPVPGPAYYSPAPNARKSYHLNARGRWMPS